jgi:hypothetical protein
VILYSVQPPEVTWQQPSEDNTVVVLDRTRTLIMIRDRNGQLRIVRLCSTEPRDYLNPRWQPGCVWTEPHTPSRSF